MSSQVTLEELATLKVGIEPAMWIGCNIQFVCGECGELHIAKVIGHRLAENEEPMFIIDKEDPNDGDCRIPFDRVTVLLYYGEH